MRLHCSAPPALGLLLSLLTPSTHAAAAAQAISLDQVQIIDTAQGLVSEPRCLRIKGSRIALVTAAGAPACTRRSTVHDLTGRYLMPGLIDMHAHLTLGPVALHSAEGKTTLSALPDEGIARHNAECLVAFGVTTVRNPGGDLAAAARYRTARAAGRLIGPQSFDAGPVINNVEIEGLSVTAQTADEVQHLVAAQVAAGADWIKLYTGLTPALLKSGIDAAHAAGRPAAAHLDAIAWPDALAMGLDGLVHLMPTSPDLLDATQRAAWQASARPGTYSFFEWWEHFDPEGPEADRLIAAFDRYQLVFDATLIAFHAAFVQDQDSPYMEDSRRHAHPRLLKSWNEGFTFAIGWQSGDFRRARAIWPKVQALAKRVYESKARVTIGTDMGNPWVAPGISLHQEMALLGDAGVSNARLLQAATVNAAQALGVADRIGRLAAGYEADLLVLKASPLERIAHTQSIEAVMLDGVLITGERLANLKGE